MSEPQELGITGMILCEMSPIYLVNIGTRLECRQKFDAVVLTSAILNANDFAQLAATKDLLVMMLCTPYVSNCRQA